MEYANGPNRLGQLVQFLCRSGSVKAKALSWGDLFFPEAHEFPGCGAAKGRPLPQASPFGGWGCKDGQSAEIGRAHRHRRLKARPCSSTARIAWLAAPVMRRLMTEAVGRTK
jgi:hypothetical protein